MVTLPIGMLGRDNFFLFTAAGIFFTVTGVEQLVTSFFFFETS